MFDAIGAPATDQDPDPSKIAKWARTVLLPHGSHLQRSCVPNDHPDPYVLRERARVGAVVRSLREWRDLRQEGLEHLSGVSYRQIRRIESGTIKAGLDSYIKLARGLNVPLDWLFSADWPQRAAEQGMAHAPGAPHGEGRPISPPERHGNTADD